MKHCTGQHQSHWTLDESTKEIWASCVHLSRHSFHTTGTSNLRLEAFQINVFITYWTCIYLLLSHVIPARSAIRRANPGWNRGWLILNHVLIDQPLPLLSHAHLHISPLSNTCKSTHPYILLLMVPAQLEQSKH